MPIDWIMSHPGYVAFATLWIAVLLARKFAKMRCSRSTHPVAEWTVVVLTLAAGGLLLDCVTRGPAAALVYVMTSTLIALTELFVTRKPRPAGGARRRRPTLSSIPSKSFTFISRRHRWA
jgi:hypothetical protein